MRPRPRQVRRGIRPVQPHTVFTAHKLDRSVRPDAARVAGLVRAGQLVPVRRVRGKWVRSATIGNHFLVPQKTAIRQGIRSGLLRKTKSGELVAGTRAGRISEEFSGTRNITFNPKDSDRPQVVAKGAGSHSRDATSSHGPRIAFERTPLDFSKVGHGGSVERSIPERAFWGGGNLGTAQTAARNARTLNEAMRRRLLARDPLVRLARRRGMASPTLVPIGLFQPLEYAFTVSPEIVGDRRYIRILRKHGADSHALESLTETAKAEGPKGAVTVTYTPVTRAKIIKIPAQAAREIIALERKDEPRPSLENLRQNPLAPTRQQVEGHRVLLYEAGRVARVSKTESYDPRDPNWQYVLKLSGFGVKPVRYGDRPKVTRRGKPVPEWVVRETLLKDFAARLAASLHLVNNVLESTLTSRHGSAFRRTNVSLSGEPMDLDEELVWKKKKSGGDLKEATETLELMWDKLRGGDYYWDLRTNKRRVGVAFPEPEEYYKYFRSLLEKGRKSLRAR